MKPPYEAIIVGPMAEEDLHTRFAMNYVEVRKRHRTDTGGMPSVFCPAMLAEGRGDEWRLQQCVDALFASPGCFVYLVPGWQGCPLAKAQWALATALGRVIVKL